MIYNGLDIEVHDLRPAIYTTTTTTTTTIHRFRFLPVAPERILKWWTRLARSAGIFVVVSLRFFGSTSTISRFGERFCDGQYSVQFGQFLVCYSSTLGAPCSLWSRRHCMVPSSPAALSSNLLFDKPLMEKANPKLENKQAHHTMRRVYCVVALAGAWLRADESETNAAMSQVAQEGLHIYYYCQMSFISSEIHTTQCCIVFTTFCCHCHSPH